MVVVNNLWLTGNWEILLSETSIWLEMSDVMAQDCFAIESYKMRAPFCNHRHHFFVANKKSLSLTHVLSFWKLKTE